MWKWLQDFWKSTNNKVFNKPQDKLKLNIQVGIDLGTHSTKVCYSIVGKHNLVAPVIFDHNLKSHPKYVCPSILAISNNRLLIGDMAEEYLENDQWGYGIRNFKTILASQYDPAFFNKTSEDAFKNYIKQKTGYYDDSMPFAFACIFLGYIMNKVEKYLSNIFLDSELDIAYNICVPIDYIEKLNIKTVFKKMFEVSYFIRARLNENNADLNLLKEVSEISEKAIHSDRVFAIPESVAEAQAYFKSLGTIEGKHALIDIGAGTVDISIFDVVIIDGEIKGHWYSGCIIPRGMYLVENLLYDYLKNQNGEALINQALINELLLNLKEDCNKELKAVVLRFFEEFKVSNEFRTPWKKAYGYCARESEWKNVTIFLSGGGSGIPGLQNIFKIPCWKHIADEARYKVELLPNPRDFKGGELNVPFHRMAVAYGLTTPEPLLHKYVLPNDCTDHTPPPMKIKDIIEAEDWYW